MFAPYKTVQMQIAALSTYLKQCGAKVEYIELIIFPGNTFEQYKNTVSNKIENFKPDLVGFSSYDMNYYFIIECASFIKKIDKGIKIIVGGHHASTAPDDYMQYKSIDYVCIGEGEFVLKDLMIAIAQDTGVESIKGLCYRDSKGSPVYSSARGIVEDLDLLPFLDRQIVHFRQIELDYLPMFAGKGCPFLCTYCANENIKNLYPNKNSYVRHRSPKKIIEEIKECKAVYNFKTVFFYDDIFSINYRWLKEFSEVYIENFPNLAFRCLMRPELITERNISLLYNSGCNAIEMGVESGSQKYRMEVLNRKMSNQTILRGASLLKKYHMALNIFMMVGLPGETFSDMLKSLWLNFRIGATSVQCAIFYPIKNTPLYRKCVELNLIDEERKKNILIYSYDTCLKYNILKRRLIILFKWLNSGMPLIRHFHISIIIHFLKIQCRKWFKKEYDYSP